MQTFQVFLSDFVGSERATLSPLSSSTSSPDRGYVDAFLRAQASGEGRHFSDEQLVISVQDFFTGGSGTMSKTLAYAVLHLIMHPDAQDRARAELQQVVGGKNY